MLSLYTVVVVGNGVDEARPLVTVWVVLGRSLLSNVVVVVDVTLPDVVWVVAVCPSHV